MRFDTEAYAKIFPRTEPTKKKVDSAVENFPPEDDEPVDDGTVEDDEEGGEE